MSKNLFQCEVCLREFSAKRNLIKHVKAGKCRNKKFKCSECPCGFTRKRVFLAHRVREHPAVCEVSVIANAHTCEVCRMQFRAVSQLEKHRALHANVEKSCVCSYCNRAYARVDSLRLHRANCSENPRKRGRQEVVDDEVDEEDELEDDYDEEDDAMVGGGFTLRESALRGNVEVFRHTLTFPDNMLDGLSAALKEGASFIRKVGLFKVNIL